ncbi:MAG: type I-D CRISPR-associated protein Cas5/Csc1, partial [Chloroflexi bacterium]
MFITVCHLTLHDFLFYASREMGRLYETEKYLHNYGLTYALGLVKSPFSNVAQVPRYQEDLSVLNQQGVYVTPAHPLHYSFAFNTFKMANVNYYNFTPQISTNQAVFGRAKEL